MACCVTRIPPRSRGPPLVPFGPRPTPTNHPDSDWPLVPSSPRLGWYSGLASFLLGTAPRRHPARRARAPISIHGYALSSSMAPPSFLRHGIGALSSATYSLPICYASLLPARLQGCRWTRPTTPAPPSTGPPRSVLTPPRCTLSFMRSVLVCPGPLHSQPLRTCHRAGSLRTAAFSAHRQRPRPVAAWTRAFPYVPSPTRRP